MASENTKILVLDIETVLDSDVPAPEKNDDGTEKFPSAAQCKIVTIGAMSLDEDLLPIQLHLFGKGQNEEGMVWDYQRFFASKAMTIVTWGGRNFDMPVINTRTLKYAWVAASYYKNARYRFASITTLNDDHIDVLDQISDFGGGRFGKLDHYAKMIGLPGKIDGDGGSVQAMHEAGKQDDIDRYCLQDVIQTAMIFQRFCVLTGIIGRSHYRLIAEDTAKLVKEYGVVPESRFFLTKPPENHKNP